jgi:hypothetical protein
MDIRPDRDTCPSSEADRGGVLPFWTLKTEQVHTAAKHVRYRIRSEGKTELATARTQFALQRIR